MIHEINNLIWLEMPKGKGVAKFLIDYGVDSDLYWVVFITKTKKCWMFANYDIGVSNNVTLGRE